MPHIASSWGTAFGTDSSVEWSNVVRALLCAARSKAGHLLAVFGQVVFGGTLRPLLPLLHSGATIILEQGRLRIERNKTHHTSCALNAPRRLRRDFFLICRDSAPYGMRSCWLMTSDAISLARSAGDPPLQPARQGAHAGRKTGFAEQESHFSGSARVLSVLGYGQHFFDDVRVCAHRGARSAWWCSDEEDCEGTMLSLILSALGAHAVGAAQWPTYPSSRFGY